MKRIPFLLVVGIAVTFLLWPKTTSAILGLVVRPNRFANGTLITEEYLKRSLNAHQEWLDSGGRTGRQFDFSGARLRNVNLKKANLEKANLAGAELLGANLEEADLTDADLTGASLIGINLTKANLRRAKLTGVDLFAGQVKNAFLQEADLQKASLTMADLTGTDLRKANLTGVYAYVLGEFFGVERDSCILTGASLEGANVTDAKLHGANFEEANLSEAFLNGANLTNANLSGANLSNAHLSNTQLSNALCYNTIYESVDGIPAKEYLGGLKGLITLNYKTPDGYSGIILLRSALKDVGLRNLERQATYAIEYGKLIHMPWTEDGKINIENCLERVFRTFLFLWPCDFGLHPGRPLWILVGFIPIFTIFYYMAICYTLGEGAIYQVWRTGRLAKYISGNQTKRLRATGLAAVRWALYFSILSATRIGWRELNPGSWIVSMQRREYILAPTDWVRTISGLQALISVYLLALAVLTYFGRPFE